MDGLIQITWWSAKQNNIENSLFLVHIYIFLSITLRKGGKFTINTAKCCLFRHRTAAAWMPFRILGRNFFYSSCALCAGTFCSAWNCTSSLSLFSILYFFFTNFRRRPFPEITIQGSLYLICTINRLYDANEPLAKDILRLCPDLPIQQKPGYLVFNEMRVFRVVWLCL